MNQATFDTAARVVAERWLELTAATAALEAIGKQVRDNTNFPTYSRMAVGGGNPQVVDIARDFIGRNLLTREAVEAAVPGLLG